MPSLYNVHTTTTFDKWLVCTIWLIFWIIMETERKSISQCRLWGVRCYVVLLQLSRSSMRHIFWSRERSIDHHDIIEVLSFLSHQEAIKHCFCFQIFHWRHILSSVFISTPSDNSTTFSMRDLELLINCDASFSQNIWHASKQSTYSKNIFTAIIRYEKSCNCEKFGNMRYFWLLAELNLKSKQSTNKSDGIQVPSLEFDNSTIDFVLQFWSQSVRSFAKYKFTVKSNFHSFADNISWWRWVMRAREF